VATAPSLNPPRLGDPIDRESSYVKRASAVTQASHWNAVLSDDLVFGPSCGLSVGVAPVKDRDGRYALVWEETRKGHDEPLTDLQLFTRILLDAGVQLPSGEKE
jgi:hypothetical protein